MLWKYCSGLSFFSFIIIFLSFTLSWPLKSSQPIQLDNKELIQIESNDNLDLTNFENGKERINQNLYNIALLNKFMMNDIESEVSDLEDYVNGGNDNGGSGSSHGNNSSSGSNGGSSGTVPNGVNGGNSQGTNGNGTNGGSNGTNGNGTNGGSNGTNGNGTNGTNGGTDGTNGTNGNGTNGSTNGTNGTNGSNGSNNSEGTNVNNRPNNSLVNSADEPYEEDDSGSWILPTIMIIGLLSIGGAVFLLYSPFAAALYGHKNTVADPEIKRMSETIQNSENIPVVIDGVSTAPGSAPNGTDGNIPKSSTGFTPVTTPAPIANPSSIGLPRHIIGGMAAVAGASALSTNGEEAAAAAAAVEATQQPENEILPVSNTINQPVIKEAPITREAPVITNEVLPEAPAEMETSINPETTVNMNETEIPVVEASSPINNGKAALLMSNDVPLEPVMENVNTTTNLPVSSTLNETVHFTSNQPEILTTTALGASAIAAAATATAINHNNDEEKHSSLQEETSPETNIPVSNNDNYLTSLESNENLESNHPDTSSTVNKVQTAEPSHKDITDMDQLTSDQRLDLNNSPVLPSSPINLSQNTVPPYELDNMATLAAATTVVAASSAIHSQPENDEEILPSSEMNPTSVQENKEIDENIDLKEDIPDEEIEDEKELSAIPESFSPPVATEESNLPQSSVEDQKNIPTSAILGAATMAAALSTVKEEENNPVENQNEVKDEDEDEDDFVLPPIQTSNDFMNSNEEDDDIPKEIVIEGELDQEHVLSEEDKFDNEDELFANEETDVLYPIESTSERKHVLPKRTSSKRLSIELRQAVAAEIAKLEEELNDESLKASSLEKIKEKSKEKSLTRKESSSAIKAMAEGCLVRRPSKDSVKSSHSRHSVKDDWHGPVFEKKVFEVVHDHIPQLPDEVKIKVGDLVEVKQVFEDGWAYGINTATKIDGTFPVNCLGEEREPNKNGRYVPRLIRVYQARCEAERKEIEEEKNIKKELSELAKRKRLLKLSKQSRQGKR